jgi:mono/diheme cytochrome c family protein
MNTSQRTLALTWAAPSVTVTILLGIALTTALMWPCTVDSATTAQEAANRPIPRWTKVSVELPASQTLFPPGNGAVIANAQCLICHSAGMVLRQPPLTQDEWVGEINKMRSAYGAPIPADQVEALAAYLHGINDLSPSPTAVEGQGS